MIKQLAPDRITALQQAVALDQLLADLDAGVRVPKTRLRAVIAIARDSIDIPTSYLSDAERANQVIEAVQTAGDPLQYARARLDQEFFANSFLPHGMRLQVADFLWNNFGVHGNPIWRNYLDGTFKYINPAQLQDDDA